MQSFYKICGLFGHGGQFLLKPLKSGRYPLFLQIPCATSSFLADSVRSTDTVHQRLWSYDKSGMPCKNVVHEWHTCPPPSPPPPPYGSLLHQRTVSNSALHPPPILIPLWLLVRSMVPCLPLRAEPKNGIHLGLYGKVFFDSDSSVSQSRSKQNPVIIVRVTPDVGLAPSNQTPTYWIGHAQEAINRHFLDRTRLKHL